MIHSSSCSCFQASDSSVASLTNSPLTNSPIYAKGGIFLWLTIRRFSGLNDQLGNTPP